MSDPQGATQKSIGRRTGEISQYSMRRLGINGKSRSSPGPENSFLSTRALCKSETLLDFPKKRGKPGLISSRWSRSASVPPSSFGTSSSLGSRLLSSDASRRAPPPSAEGEAMESGDARMIGEGKGSCASRREELLGAFSRIHVSLSRRPPSSCEKSPSGQSYARMRAVQSRDSMYPRTLANRPSIFSSRVSKLST